MMRTESEKFNAFSKTWWDPNGPLKTLHHINPTRFNFIKQHSDLKGKRLLDVGCGAGLLTEALAKAGAIATGIDLGKDLISAAKEHAKLNQYSIEYQHASVEDLLDQKPNQFDIICCMELLEHLASPEIFLRHLKGLLKPGGKLYLSTLNRSLKSYLLAIIAAEYVLKLVPQGTHDYAAFIQPSELNDCLCDLGYACLDMRGIAYQPFFKKAKLVPDLSVNYIAVYEHLS